MCGSADERDARIYFYRDDNKDGKKIVGRHNRLLNSLESEIAAYSIHFVWKRNEEQKKLVTIIFTQIESERVFSIQFCDEKNFVPTTLAHQRPINFLEMKYKYPPRIQNEIGRGYFVGFFLLLRSFSFLSTVVNGIAYCETVIYVI